MITFPINTAVTNKETLVVVEVAQTRVVVHDDERAQVLIEVVDDADQDTMALKVYVYADNESDDPSNIFTIPVR